ncbi:MAG: tetratricopeptide repeat protein [Phycisphaerales bacterium]
MTTTGPSWYHDESSLLAELRRTAVAVPATPHISGYEDLRELRRGGQGVVYAAEQKSTHRKVAVKVLLESGEGAIASRRRFEREVDLVASLRHPGVVNVYDSGVTDDGRPFLVMEFVEGQPLDQFVRTRGWAGRDGARSVVGLMVHIADAVQYAHHRGVIHRDLKPSNIRVSEDGLPHVLDFGLAKPLAASGGGLEASISTSGQFLGSLAWASPEQAGGDPHAIDARTDVYAMGVLLYHTLTGRFPYEVSRGLRTTLDNIVKLTPARPTTAAPWMDRELESVILRCLEKEPALRYQSAGDLAQDLNRWLAGEPVQAGGTGAWSTLRHTVRRHRAVLAIVSAALLLVGGVAVTMSVLYARALSAEAESRSHLVQVEAARSEAEHQASEKDLVNQFLRDMLAAADPSADGRQAKVVDLLDRASKQIDGDTRLSPEARAALHQTIGNTYVSLGQHAAADPHLRAAAESRAELLGRDHPDTVASLVNLAYLRLQEGKHDEAEKLQRDAVARAIAHLTPEQRVRSGARQGLGMTLYERGRWDESEQVLREGLAEARSAPGDNIVTAAQIANSLAITLRHQSKLDEAEQLYRAELERIAASAGTDHAFALQLMNNLASLLHQRGNWGEAERLYRASAAGRDRLLGPSHPETITTRTNLAKFLADRQRFDDALPMYAELLVAARAGLGPEHPTTLTILNNYAKALQDADRLEEAEEMNRLVVDLRTKVLGPDHPNTMISMSNLATLLAFRGKPEQSIEMQRELLARRERKLGPKANDTLITVNNLGLGLQKAGRPDEALPMFQRAVGGAEEVIGVEHWITGAFRGNLGRCLGALNRLEEAEKELLESNRVLVAKLGPGHAQAKQSVKSLNDLYTKMGKPDEAAKYVPVAAPAPK